MKNFESFQKIQNSVFVENFQRTKIMKISMFEKFLIKIWDQENISNVEIFIILVFLCKISKKICVVFSV